MVERMAQQSTPAKQSNLLSWKLLPTETIERMKTRNTSMKARASLILCALSPTTLNWQSASLNTFFHKLPDADVIYQLAVLDSISYESNLL
jgi:hypothetical protein